jgi:glycosyltransferase involved in cell wall biosynthesis
MRIAINARSILLANRTGIGRYTYHLIDALAKIDSHNQYWLHVQKNLLDFKRRSPQFSYPNVIIKKDSLSSSSSLKGADIYHNPSPGPLDIQGIKTVVTVHDLIYKMYPQSHTQETLDLTEKYMQEIIKKADHIICISKNTRDDLHHCFNFPQERSSIVYNGVDHQVFYRLDEQGKQQAKKLLAEKGINDPFILFTGTLEPRKNLAGLLEAFADIRRRNKFAGKLVVVGRKGWMHEPTDELLNRLDLEKEVIFLGYVSDEELRCLYNLAEVFVLPSFYEGFGFPIVEAFCCGAAIVTSNNSSCGEIAGDAALTIDPKEPSQITQAITQLLEDRDLNEKLRHKALARSKQFAFDKTAQETLKIYEKLVA